MVCPLSHCAPALSRYSAGLIIQGHRKPEFTNIQYLTTLPQYNKCLFTIISITQGRIPCFLKTEGIWWTQTGCQESRKPQRLLCCLKNPLGSQTTVSLFLRPWSTHSASGEWTCRQPCHSSWLSGGSTDGYWWSVLVLLVPSEVAWAG